MSLAAVTRTEKDFGVIVETWLCVHGRGFWNPAKPRAACLCRPVLSVHLDPVAAVAS